MFFGRAVSNATKEYLSYVSDKLSALASQHEYERFYDNLFPLRV